MDHHLDNIDKLLKGGITGNIVCYRFLRSLITLAWLAGVIVGLGGILGDQARLRSIICLGLGGSKLDCALSSTSVAFGLSGVKIDWAIYLAMPHIPPF